MQTEYRITAAIGVVQSRTKRNSLTQSSDVRIARTCVTSFVCSPAADVVRIGMRADATLTRTYCVTHLVVDQTLLDPFVFVAGLQRHGVHAALATVVARAQPVLFDALQGRIAPREEVAANTQMKCRNQISMRQLVNISAQSVRLCLLTPCCRAPARGSFAGRTAPDWADRGRVRWGTGRRSL